MNAARKALLAAGLLFAASSLHAHFPWLAAGADGHALLFFGETPAERAYKIPVPVMEAQVHVLRGGELEPVTFVERIEEGFMGRASDVPMAADSRLLSKIEYGNYHGMFLQYYAVHQGGQMPGSAMDVPSSVTDVMPMFAQAVRTDGGVQILVSWKGEALAGAKVTLFDEAGQTLATATSDATGSTTFAAADLASGFNGLNVGHETAEPKETHYLTLTFEAP